MKTQINEINFNNRDHRQTVLTAPIQCGFEIEVVWEVPKDVDTTPAINWASLSASKTIQKDVKDNIAQSYATFLKHTDEYMGEVARLSKEWARRNNGKHLAQFFAQEHRAPDTDDLQSVLNHIKSDPRATEAYETWLEEVAATTLGAKETVLPAIQYAKERVDIDAWAIRMGGWAHILNARYGIDVPPALTHPLPNHYATIVQQWTKANSKHPSVVSGDAKGARPTDTQWAVEPDVSIVTDIGYVGMEIISPVYDTPADMLAEMLDLFAFLEQNGATTNTTTGLHVTMSWSEDEEAELNKIKLLMTMGERYIAKSFSREDNPYATSQLGELRTAFHAIRDGEKLTMGSVRELEDILNGLVSDTKYKTVHFKPATNDMGNALIEFRIAGGENYQRMTKEVMDSVVRYATAMIAGYTEEYTKDYVAKLLKFVHEVVTPVSMSDLTIAPRRALSALQKAGLKLPKPVIQQFQQLATETDPATASEIAADLLFAVVRRPASVSSISKEMSLLQKAYKVSDEAILKRADMFVQQYGTSLTTIMGVMNQMLGRKPDTGIPESRIVRYDPTDTELFVKTGGGDSADDFIPVPKDDYRRLVALQEVYRRGSTVLLSAEEQLDDDDATDDDIEALLSMIPKLAKRMKAAEDEFREIIANYADDIDGPTDATPAQPIRNYPTIFFDRGEYH